MDSLDDLSMNTRAASQPVGVRLFAGASAALLALLLSACGSDSGEQGIDPGIVEVPIAYIKRPIPVDEDGDDINLDWREPRSFSSGGDVFLRSNSAANADETNISAAVTGGIGDVKGLNASFDGERIIFSAREFDPNPNDDDDPPWNLYEYDLTDSSLRSVMPLGLANQGDDLYPAYLADGRIVFSSDRQDQAQSNLINEGKQAFSALDEDRNVVALTLHVINSDGTGLRQISSNMSHDLRPQALENIFGGQIVFSRWENAGGNDMVQLYKVNPDGSNLEVLYGTHSEATGSNPASDLQFTFVRETTDGDLVVIARPFDDTFDGGDIYRIDVAQYADNDKPIWSLTGLTGPAQRSVTFASIPTDDTLSLAGRYSSAFPLRDGTNRMLVSKSTCQLDVNDVARPCVDPYLSDPDAEEASPTYAIWLLDASAGTEKPVVIAESGMVITEAIAIDARVQPAVVVDKSEELDDEWVAENVGVVNIKSVYDIGNESFDGCFFGYCETSPTDINSVQDFADPVNATADQRRPRFVRFIKPVGLPDPDDPSLVDPPDLANTAFGRNRNLGMREIVGYAPIEPDGSVMVKVPASTPLAVEVLDSEGRRIGPRHENWFQVIPGDTLTCNGCHTHDTGANTPEIHGRSDGAAPSINSGIGPGLTFPNTLIPGTTIEYFSTNVGETMAEVRFARVGSAVPEAPEPVLSADLNYVDYWTDPAARAPDASYSYSYEDLSPLVLSPIGANSLRNSNCESITPSVQNWRYNCRVTINYARHIHAIWEQDRGAADLFTPLPPQPAVGSPVTDLLVDNVNTDGFLDDTCITCHTTEMGTRIAYGQLDLTTDPNQDPADFFRAFVEMFFNDTAQVLDVDDNIIDDPNITIAPRMTANGARSSYFIEKMTGEELDAGRSIDGSVDHTGMLTPAELKLISEWLDLGGQNFNDPFDPAAPQN